MDLDTACHFDPDPFPSFQIKVQNLGKCSNRLIFHTSYILACHLQIDPYPCPDPTFQFNADPDLNPQHCRKGKAGNVLTSYDLFCVQGDLH